jgi:Ni,Fe-hydrogenase III small subunit/NAD-dependent dihydropyrimidine dehydrogenase PreA subunit
MLDVFRERLRQGHRTSPYPSEPPVLPDRFRGLPVLHPEACHEGCSACGEACPTNSVQAAPGAISLDMGRCLFCGECAAACPTGALTFSKEYRLAGNSREGLKLDGRGFQLGRSLEAKLLRLFGRSLKLRQVSAGGCNGCEADVNVLGTVVFDLARFGIQMVASPRHADGILITGPVTQNMKSALLTAYDAVPAPKIVIAVGACAISGGPYVDNPEQNTGADSVLPVDLYIPGCPPHPWTIVFFLLRLLGRLEDQGAVLGP